VFNLIFEINEPGQTYFVGLQVDSPSNGIGAAKFKKFILNPNLAVVAKVLKVAVADIPAGAYVCGDLKMIFSSYGNDARSRLNGQFPGENRNAVPPALLQALSTLRRRDLVPAPTGSRDCAANRVVVDTTNYWRRITTPLPVAVVPNNDHYFSIYRCNTDGSNAVTELKLKCVERLSPAAQVGSGFIRAAQVTLQASAGGLTSTSIYFGRDEITSNANRTVKELVLTMSTISQFEVYYPTTGISANNNWYAIRYTSTAGVQTDWTCGTNANISSGNLRQTITPANLLGIWGGLPTGALVTENSPLNYFGFVRYV
jgi:hypothetical protein